MAKKLRRVRTSRRFLLFLLLIPWAVMGLAALVGLQLGLGEVLTTVFALGCSLTATVAVRMWMTSRGRTTERVSEP